MSNIWFFGDSTTYGHGLRPGFDYWDYSSEYRGQRWTRLFADNFGGNPINHGVCGASNEDIKLRIVSQMHKIQKGDMVVLQPTYPTRINIFTNDGEYKPIHVAFGEDSFLEGRISDEQMSALKDFTRYFLVDNTERFEQRDILHFIGLKKELESKGVDVLLWHHEVMNEMILKHMGWKTIKEESNGDIDDLHLGWDAQKKFSDFLIKEYKKGNTFICPNPEFYEDISKLHFRQKENEKTFETLYKFVGRKGHITDYEITI
jgi:hypothetical protein